MRTLDYNRIIVGYHGCDRSVVESVFLQGKSLLPSQNDYDWLGEGIYFWEYGPQRALEFALQQKARSHGKKVQNPAVLGAYIQLGNCFDLTDTRCTGLLQKAFEEWSAFLLSAGLPLPKNKGGKDRLLRLRDCALLNWYLKRSDLESSGGRPYYQSVRGIFTEGELLYEDAGFFTQTHTQVAIRDPDCILGYFLPPPLLKEGSDDTD